MSRRRIAFRVGEPDARRAVPIPPERVLAALPAGARRLAEHRWFGLLRDPARLAAEPGLELDDERFPLGVAGGAIYAPYVVQRGEGRTPLESMNMDALDDRGLLSLFDRLCAGRVGDGIFPVVGAALRDGGAVERVLAALRVRGRGDGIGNDADDGGALRAPPAKRPR